MHPAFILLRGDPAIGVIFIAIILALVVLTYFFSKKMIIKRALRKTQEKRIADFMQGEKGRVSGRVVFAGRKLTAPLTKRECVYYHVIVEEHRSSGKSSHWATVVNEEQKADIVIFDGSHYAVVDTNNMKSYLIHDANYSSGTFNDATPELEEFLVSRGYKSTGLFGWNKSLRYREGVLEKDETFAVAGHGNWVETRTLGFSLPGNKVLIISPAGNEPVYLSDDPDVRA